MSPDVLVPDGLKAITNISEHNFLINGLIVDFLRASGKRYARGVLADIGCGKKPYRALFAPYVERHVGVDIKQNETNDVDVLGSAYETHLDSAAYDTILCTEVLEHLEEPNRAIAEMRRLLRPGGHVILTVPFFWHIHEAPRDFYRYSEYGLRHLFESGGFEIVELRPLTGFVVTFTQLGIYYVRTAFPRARSALRVPFYLAQRAASFLNERDNSRGYTSVYGLVARRRDD